MKKVKIHPATKCSVGMQNFLFELEDAINKGSELTYEIIIKELGDIGGLIIAYDEGTETVRFTSEYQDCISDLNQYLLDCYPHYLDNISYNCTSKAFNVKDRTGYYWLELICIRRGVA